MDVVTRPLDELRADVDRIDRAIVELLVERTAVVREIGAVKNDRRDGRLAVRPAREAELLRRLTALAGDRLPAAVLVRMWRELLAYTTRLQTPVSVAVFTPPSGLVTWDLARDHFGSLTPMTRVDSVSQALRALGAGSATVAVVPMPSDDAPWWSALLSDQGDRVRVFARLPAIVGPDDEARALALGRLELEPSGDDLTLLAIETEAGLSRGRLRELFSARGLTPTWLAAWRPTEPAQALHLIEVGAFVEEGDPQVAEIIAAARGEILRVVQIGGYPRPITAA